jgi:putative transcriptional regulator
LRIADYRKEHAMRNTRFTALLAFLLACTPLAAAAAELSGSLVLVAKPELHDPLYGKTVLVVAPFGNDQHMGFIINRPTDLTLGKIFPEHLPSRKVADPVFLGGPVDATTIFALVPQADNPGGKSVQIMPGLFAVIDAPTVDKIIEANPEDARFVAGLVVWRPGELRREVELGAWHVMDSDPALATREPEGLWEELVQRMPNGRAI